MLSTTQSINNAYTALKTPALWQATQQPIYAARTAIDCTMLLAIDHANKCRHYSLKNICLPNEIKQLPKKVRFVQINDSRQRD